MSNAETYASDLAYVHDRGFGGVARDSAPGLLNLLRQSGIARGRIVDVGCGSGIWARQLVDAGFEVTGLDLSRAMIAIARRHVPEAEFHFGSFLSFPIPSCRAIIALGEVFNYLFDAGNSLGSLTELWTRIPHFHQASRQFFYILRGTLTMLIGPESILLTEGTGMEVPPETVHQAINGGPEDVRFLVISQPPSHGDREDAPNYL